jgi:dihydrofolate reductase
MNNMPKYVVSATLKHADWNNSTVIKSNIVQEVSKLMAMSDGDILIAGSAQLVSTLMQHDLIDEYRLMVYPVVLGKGKRLFRDGIDRQSLRLVEAKSVGSGILILIYHPERKQ